MRLIDADEIRWADHYDSDGNLSKYKVAFSDEMPPTVDAVPVRHGKWIPRYIKIAGLDYKHGMKCSVCSEPALDAEGDDYLTDYCPNCGARMDKDGR